MSGNINDNPEEWSRRLCQRAASVTRAGNSLSSSRKSSAHASMQEAGGKIIALMKDFLKHCDVTADVVSNATPNNLFDNFEDVVEALEPFYDKLDQCLDRARGLSMESKPVDGTLAQSVIKGKRLDWYMIHSDKVERSQRKFKDAIDNSVDIPFIPKIRIKPHATYELDAVLKTPEKFLSIPKDTQQMIVDTLKAGIDIARPPTVDTLTPSRSPAGAPSSGNTMTKTKSIDKHIASLQGDDDGVLPKEILKNGYELERLEHQSWQLDRVDPVMYPALEATPCSWIDNESGLLDLISKLSKVNEFAVDLENHNYRTDDYLIDTLELRHVLCKLNEVFVNPRILKVLHGSDMDIIWLQRDFGLYVVNMFDTVHSHETEYPSFGLAYLLKTLCNVDANKQYQLADWRLRPLPTEMYKYAREDTHYLLYIYDNLRNELLDKGDATTKNMLKSVYQRSTALCLNRYEKPEFAEDALLNLAEKSKWVFNKEQQAVYLAVAKWRDTVARLEDESLRYIMPNESLCMIALRMPTTGSDVLDCCNKGIPPAVRRYADDIARMIVKCRTSTVAMPAPSKPSAPTYYDLNEVFESAGWKAEVEVDVKVSMKNRSSLLGDFPKFNELYQSDQMELPPPTTLPEIYAISNNNRKDNKEKKRMLEEAAGDNTEVIEVQSSDDVEFARSLGWPDADPLTVKPLHSKSRSIGGYTSIIPEDIDRPRDRRAPATQPPPVPPPKARRESPVNQMSPNVVPFDYNSTPRQTDRAPAPGPSDGMYNPYSAPISSYKSQGRPRQQSRGKMSHYAPNK